MMSWVYRKYALLKGTMLCSFLCIDAMSLLWVLVLAVSVCVADATVL